MFQLFCKCMEKTGTSNKQNKSTSTEPYANKLKQNRVNWSKVPKYFMKLLESKKNLYLILFRFTQPTVRLSASYFWKTFQFRDGLNRLF